MNNQIDLAQEWAADMAALGAMVPRSEEILANILARYGETGRHYHGTKHLQALFALVQTHAPQPAGSAVRLAIWWHDVIYDPMSKENEAKSAVMARHDLTQLGAQTALVDAVCALILATQNHFKAPSCGTGDIFLDADIAILGAPTALYQRYVEQIRAEYAVVPKPLFDAGRLAFLKQAVGQVPMFKTALFEGVYGEQARANMADEIGQLEAQGH